MQFFFLLLSAANISGIFLLADSPAVFHIGRFNPYSLLHIPLYAILTALLLMALASRPGAPRASRYHLAAWTAVAVAGADEYFQSFLPNREPSVGDFLLDLLGMALVLALAVRVPPSRWLRPLRRLGVFRDRGLRGVKINSQGGRVKKAGFLAPAMVLFLLFPALSFARSDLFNAEDYNIELEGRYWKPTLDSTVKILSNDLGTDVRAVEDLGFDEKKSFGEGRLQVKFFRKHKFNLSYLPLEWKGDRVLTRTIQYGGTTYSAGTQILSRLDLKIFKGGYEYDFVAGKYGFIGATFDLLLADYSIELKAPSLGSHQTHDYRVPLPAIGLIARWNIVPWVGLTAKVSGLPLGSYGHVLDAEGALDINPVKYLGVSAGYRFFRLKGDYRDYQGDVRLDGPFAALKVRF